MLEKALIENKFSYCVVGNSPCELGTNNGKKIDSHNIVFRFNDFSLNPKFQNDYGSKKNAWVRGTNDKLVYTMEQKKRHLKKFDLIILRAKDKRNEGFRRYCDEGGIRYYVLPLKNELELTSELGSCPSTGLLFLFNLKKITGIISRDQIFGFSFCEENRKKNNLGKQVHYYNDGKLINPETGKAEKIKNTFLISKHNWEIEEQFFRERILKN